VEVTVTDSILTIAAERRDDFVGKHHSEFHYGTVSRNVTLPAGADEEHIEAIYGRGILEVTVKVAPNGATKTARKIPVRQNHHIKPT
jgi:HSP20 family protein